MTIRTVPFHYGLFYHAMIGLLGREPDSRHRYGDSGLYLFRYKPNDKAEMKKFAEGVVALQEWLSMFELTPIQSRCEYGRLLSPEKGEDDQDYLDIRIVHPLEKNEES